MRRGFRIGGIAAGLIAIGVFLLMTRAPLLAESGTRASTIAISGALPRTGAISLAELQKLAPTKAIWTSRGERHELTGVRLDKLLASFGFESGSMGKDIPKRQKRSGGRKVVVATAPDGFAAVLSCAEIFEEMGTTQALLVWEIDGKPLPPERGPFRLVVLTDKEPLRSVYSLNKIEVVDLSGRVP